MKNSISKDSSTTSGVVRRLVRFVSARPNLAVIALTILAITGISIGTFISSRDLENKLIETFYRTNSLVSTTTASHLKDYLESRASGLRSLAGVLDYEKSLPSKIGDINGYYDYLKEQHVRAMILLSTTGDVIYSTDSSHMGRNYERTRFWEYVSAAASKPISPRVLSNQTEALEPLLPFTGSSGDADWILMGLPIFHRDKAGNIQFDGAVALLMNQFEVVPRPISDAFGLPDTTLRMAIGVLSGSAFPFIHLWSNDSAWNKQGIKALQREGKASCASCHTPGDIDKILSGSAALGTGVMKTGLIPPASGKFLWSSAKLQSSKLAMQDSTWYVVVSADRGPVQMSIISYLKGSIILMSSVIVLLVIILSLSFYIRRRAALEQQQIRDLEQIAGLRGQYEVLIQKSNDGIYVLSGDKLILANKKFQEMFGYTQDELMKNDFMNLVAPESRPLIMERSQRLARGEEIESRYSFTAISKDGKKMPVEVSLTQVQLDGKRSAIGILRDLSEITAQKQLYEELFRSAPIGLAIYKDLRVIRINNTATDLLGYDDPDDLVGTNVLEKVHPEDLAVVGARVRRAIEEHIPAPPMEERLLKKDGSVIHVLVLSQPIIYEGKDAVQLAFVSLEDRKKLEENLAREAAMQEREKVRLSTLLQSLEEGILFQGSDGTVEFANTEFCRIFGFDSPSGVIGKNSKDILIHSASRTKFPEEFVKRIAGSVERREYVRAERLEFVNGMIVERDALPILNSDGQYLGRVAVFRDITKREEKEETIKRLQRTELLGRLAGGIAHDFNNVLGIIIASLQMMMRKADNQGVIQENAQRALSSAIRGSEVAKRLLQFVRYSPETFKDFSVRQIIEETESIIRHTFEENFTVRTEYILNDATVYGSAGDIQQVLINLAKNAQDAMPKGGTLTISLTTADKKQVEKKLGGAPAGEYVLLMFQDTGQGIEADKLEKIFDPFFTTKDLGKGTGLGLSIVQTIISAHNGFIEVKSRPDSGTTFFIYLPMIGREVHTVESGQPNEQNEVEPGVQGKTILLIEDELALRELVSEFMSEKGYRVITAPDGEEGYRAFKNHPEICLVLTDLGLPKISGDKLISQMKSERPELKCILATGYLTPTADGTLSNLKVKMVMKPYNLNGIYNLVTELLSED